MQYNNIISHRLDVKCVKINKKSIFVIRLTINVSNERRNFLCLFFNEEMSRRMSQPCDIYDAPPYSNRCADVPCFNWNDINNCEYRPYPCSQFQRDFTPCSDNTIEVCVPTVTPCDNIQICKTFKLCNNNCNDICSNVYDCKPKALKTCLKKCCNNIQQKVCFVDEQDCCPTIPPYCCNPLTYCSIRRSRFIKTTGIFIVITLIFFAWLINNFLASCAPRGHYRFC